MPYAGASSEFGSFMRGLRELGYKLGETVSIDCRSAGRRNSGLADCGSRTGAASRGRDRYDVPASGTRRPQSDGCVPRFLVDLRCLRASHRMCAVALRIEADAGHPLVHDSSVLPRRHVRPRADATREQKVLLAKAATDDPRSQGIPSVFRYLELHWTCGLLLNNHRRIAHAAGRRYVADCDGDQIAASELAVDCEIEERQIPFSARHLKSCPDTPDLTRLQRRLLADAWPLFQLGMVILPCRPPQPQRPIRARDDTAA